MGSADVEELTLRDILVFVCTMVVIGGTILAVGGVLHAFPTLSGPGGGGESDVGSPTGPVEVGSDGDGEPGANEPGADRDDLGVDGGDSSAALDIDADGEGHDA